MINHFSNINVLVGRAKCFFVAVDYFVLGVVASFCPLFIGRFLSQVRGLLHALVDYDWRSNALGVSYIRPRVWQSLRLLHPENSVLKTLYLLIGRYINASVEEWEALALDRLVARLPFPSSPALRSCDDEPSGIVYLMFHYGSFILGIAWLGRSLTKQDKPLNAMASNIFLHPQVHPSVRKLFIRKYELLERYLHGGKVIFVEEGLKQFYRLLANNEGLFVLTDGVTHGKAAFRVDFAGLKDVPFVPGAKRLLDHTGVCHVPFACDFHQGRYRLLLGCKEADVAFLPGAIAFHGDLATKHPQRWLASDLLVG